MIAIMIIWGVVAGLLIGLALLAWSQRGESHHQPLSYEEGFELTKVSANQPHPLTRWTIAAEEFVNECPDPPGGWDEVVSKELISAVGERR